MLPIGITPCAKRRKQRKMASHPVVAGVHDSLRMINGLGGISGMTG
jgi:hypothetical protein